VTSAESLELGRINKACRRLSDLRATAISGEIKIATLDSDEIEAFMSDIRLVEGWRERHAGPLRNANANLRHYVRPHFIKNAKIVSVTQRLKKLSTILDKLQRYPTMRLTGMEDIGGVRAVLPTQAAADDVPAGCARTGRSTATATMSASPRIRDIGRCI
jgi:hypothetical protein